jgi:hypothetical protein
MITRNRNGNRILRCMGVVAALAFGSIACGPDYERTDITSTVPDELGGGVNVQKLTVHEGMILKTHLTVWNDDKEQMKLTIRSDRDDIVEVGNVISANDFVFIGKHIGQAAIEIRADDELVLRIFAEVVPQPAPP